MSRDDPMDSHQWKALARESKLARELIGNGITALGNATYGDTMGEYYVAFFGLSVGIERLAKLILVADYAIEQNGQLPPQSYVQKLGHSLEKLIERVSEIEKKHNLKITYRRPTDKISSSSMACLNSFAEAREGRYANFDSLGNPNFDTEFEPIRKWWSEVSEPILRKHFYGSKSETGVRNRAKTIDTLWGKYSLVRFTAEDGSPIDSVETASYRTGASRYTQKYGRYYTMQFVRWLSDVFQELTQYGCYTRHVDLLFGHYEHFQTYVVEDEYLKTRKRWPL